MGNFYPLAIGHKHYRMVADHVTATHSGKTNSFALASAGLTFAAVNRHFAQIALNTFCHGFAHGQCGTGGSIDLVTVVGLINLDVVIITQNFRSLLEQLERDVNASAEVSRLTQRSLSLIGQQLLLFFRRKTGGANDDFLAGRSTGRGIG